MNIIGLMMACLSVPLAIGLAVFFNGSLNLAREVEKGKKQQKKTDELYEMMQDLYFVESEMHQITMQSHQAMQAHQMVDYYDLMRSFLVKLKEKHDLIQKFYNISNDGKIAEFARRTESVDRGTK